MVVEIITRILDDKGLPTPAISESTELLGSSLGIDSLDLAAIVVELTQATEVDPFESGFIDFRTVGQLVELYSQPAQA